MLYAFVQNYFVSLAMVVYMLVFICTNNLLPKQVTKQFTKATITALLLIIVDNIELWTATFEHPTMLRVLMSAIGYSLRPFVLLSVLSFLSPEKKRRHHVYAGIVTINSIVVFSALFTDLAYSYSVTNEFIRGPLGYTTHIVCIILLTVVLIESCIAFKRKRLSELLIIFAINIIMITAIVLESLYQFEGIGTGGMIASILFYFLNYHSQNLRRDTLTGCYNNTSFRLDTDKLSAQIDGVIVVDMNNLKEINDTLGHAAGDSALIEMVQIIENILPASCRLYRIGGDEFAIVCTSMWKFEIDTFIQKVSAEMEKTDISWSMGLAYKDVDFKTMMRKADEAMYAQKKEMKERRKARKTT